MPVDKLTTPAKPRAAVNKPRDAAIDRILGLHQLPSPSGLSLHLQRLLVDWKWCPFSISRLSHQVRPPNTGSPSNVQACDPLLPRHRPLQGRVDAHREPHPRDDPRHSRMRDLQLLFHGERADPNAKPTTVSDDPDMPRLHHPAVGDDDLLVGSIMAEVKRLRASDSTRPIIGVGHSMGAIALWITEITHPGTFARLVLFEPIYNFTGPMQQAGTSFLVAATLKRRSWWPSRAAAIADLSNARGFSRWHPEALAVFVYGGGLVDNEDGSASLSLTTEMEAAFLSYDPVVYTTEQLAAPHCRVVFHGVERSKTFMRKTFMELSRKWPATYSMAPMIANASHQVNVENPELVATRILDEVRALALHQRSISTMMVARL